MSADKKPFEVISVNSYETACDGGGGPLGHPRVFLHIDHNTGRIMCPYCSRLFIYKAPKAKAS